MAQRRTFVTKNQLNVSRYAVIVAGFFVLLVLFCALGNIGLIRAWLSASETRKRALRARQILDEEAPTQQGRIDAELAQRAEQGGARIALYGSGDLYDLFAAQFFMAKHSYIAADRLDDSVEGIMDVDMIFVASETLLPSEAAWLSGRVEAGCTVVFGVVPSLIERDGALQELLGVEYVGAWQEYAGLRISSEFLDGNLVQDPDRSIAAWEVGLMRQTKVYGFALPEDYESWEYTSLPPVAWRYIAKEGYGAVYACNGDFMYSEIAYALIPLVMRETHGNYVYPVVNAYCVFATGFPYVANEARDEWMWLYSRDKLGIQRDMLMPEFERLAQIYGARITYFSDDYNALLEGDDAGPSDFAREITSQEGQLALRIEGRLCLTSPDDAVLIDAWQEPFRLWDSEAGSYELPLNHIVTSQNYERLPDPFCLASITGSIGYYGVCVDVDDFLNTTGEANYWSDYTKAVEVLFGTHRRDYDWIDRVTADEALCRINKMLNLKADIAYGDDGIVVTIDEFDGQAWFVLRTGHGDLAVEGAELRTIGEGVYLLSANVGQVVVHWSDGI